MENYNSEPTGMRFKQPVAGANAALVLGILSLIFIGLIGLILAIIAITQGNQARSAYAQNPDAYTEGSLKNANAGRICGIISLSILGAILVIAGIVLVVENM